MPGQPLGDQKAFWDERYSDTRFAFGTEPNAFLVSQAAYVRPGSRALVPGDGEGRNGVWLAGQGLAVDTVDISPVGAKKAATLAASRGVSLNAIVADLSVWAWPVARYDVVASLYVHFLDANRPAMHASMIAALKPGGVLILEAFEPRQLDMQKHRTSGGPKMAEMLYSEEKLRADFASQDILLLQETETTLAEGHRHRGPASVVRAVVRRTG